MKSPTIIGITGMLGAGKGTVADYLIQKGFKHFSVREFITREIEKNGLPVNRDTMRTTANNLRKQHGGDYIVRALVQEAKDTHCNAVIESIRTVDEVHALNELGALLISVDADIHTRYARITERQSSTDQVSFSTFQEQERLESESTNPAEQNLKKVHDLTDPAFRLMNNGSRDELYAQIDRALQNML